MDFLEKHRRTCQQVKWLYLTELSPFLLIGLFTTYGSFLVKMKIPYKITAA